MVGMTRTEELPAFPADIPVADIPRLSLAKLLADDARESDALFNASKEHGFFLLDLSDAPEGQKVLADVDNAFSIGRVYFNRPFEEKQKDSMNGKKGNIGYKPTGVLTVSQNKKDSGFSRCMDGQRSMLTAFCDHVHPLAILILKHIAKNLDIFLSSFLAQHDPAHLSATNVRLIHNPPQLNHDRHTSLPAHTDSGSITILFTRVGGLQLLPPGVDASQESAWRWVKPEQGCAVINMGDPMVQWTGGLLKSAYHRVQYAPGAQASLDRYSVGYFLKPHHEASMSRIEEGNVIPRAAPNGSANGHATYAEWQAFKSAGLINGDKAVSRGVKV